jgi:Spy/CpxP family protein refolding chaperone
MQAKIFVAAAFVLTFAAGVLTGALVVRKFSFPEPPRWTRMSDHPSGRGQGPPPLRMEILKSQLDLDATQSQRIEEIIARGHEQLRQKFGQLRLSSHQVFKQMAAEIDSVLTPEQRQKFHAEFPLPHWKKLRRPRRMPSDSLDDKF